MTHHRPRHARLAAFAGLAALLLITIVPASVARGATTIGLPLRASGLQALTQVTNAGDGSNRLFLVEKRGVVRVYQNGAVKAGTFLDLRGLIGDSSGERGLLGLVFHPQFETNRRLYVYYTRTGGDIVVARLRANASGSWTSRSTLEPMLVIEHSAHSNHNGGGMAFGPDGYLYISTGDGGGAGDPGRNAQSKTKNLLGKILRINPGSSGAGPYRRYAIPTTNPFRGATTGLDEIWAYGLRNPWRISFDRATGSLFIADVGQSRYEEIDREPPAYHGGRNYGWNVMEGKHCYNATSCSTSGKTLPVAEYGHTGGNCSITGGYVYRGSAYPALAGLYVFADYCSGRFYTMPAGGSSLSLRRDTILNVTSFGESEDGELYAVTINGRLYQVTATTT
ncbi:MAG TPA: PQQ-dependent sugar dehydrogenase [Candidatus Limnocylindrales bacterium]|nr:PQQ-dependent sugar dehydrogenase [Candidatus Limnocylindrales bacterium]